ncbi:DNA/RNA polymerase [Plenodomus tracheiphilus IPT5]|uniref:DNA/RNA polymerase n=1 Tax=Plenodomus tracheiphilus IPT5 TaxID=1408161 RepID=A0A6A7AZS6_9PLEO|nr:DNA/RNA polymerase [Plenodomus tracheiphilus IPT5]
MCRLHRRRFACVFQPWNTVTLCASSCTPPALPLHTVPRSIAPTPALSMQRPRKPRRQLDSILLHFDCFYASVFEQENPSLRTLPLAVQQKQIVVTCNYEARRRGLYKLQLITEAKRLCPEVVIVLGEDLTKFRNASKQLYAYFRSFSWNSRCERLGFDEVFMDVSDMIEYNVAVLGSATRDAFFVLSKDDPTAGFQFDATHPAGHIYPELAHSTLDVEPADPLYIRLLLASHLAHYLRTRLEEETGYTATVGISTNKLLSKLVGNQHKPNAQTTLLPPYSDVDETGQDNVTAFMDEFEIGKLPGIGFKMAQQLRAKILGREAGFENGLVYGGTKEHVRVRDVRSHPGMSPILLERMLGGPGVPQGVGARVWGLLNGSDESEVFPSVGEARDIPKQISIEDSYIRLDTLDQVTKELTMLVRNLLKRMYTDLLEADENVDVDARDVATSTTVTPSKRWLAHPRTIRLSTRPRPPQNPDGCRNRSFARTSRSAPLPNFALSLKDSINTVAEKLVNETLLPLFRKLHPEKKGWNLSLVNVAVTNMANAASEKGGTGQDIGKMFRRQDRVLKQWKVEGSVSTLVPEDSVDGQQPCMTVELLGQKLGSEDIPTSSLEEHLGLSESWTSDDDGATATGTCGCDQCGAMMPVFAIGPHIRWHKQTDQLG